MKTNLPVTNKETPYPTGRYIVSRTDLKGITTYGNDTFFDISGFRRDELIGKNHNLVRHPDMPPQAFAWLWETVKTKVVIAQTITQALQFTLTATTIGFVNKSALYTPELMPFNKPGLNWIEVPTDLYAPIEQAAVLLKAGANNSTAHAFLDFLTSPEARSIFLAYGYALPMVSNGN